MAVFPTLDFMQISARYPKAVKKITEWIFSQPELQSVTEDFIDPIHPEESKEQFTGLMIQMDPRKLYDVFDSFGIYIGVQAGVELMGGKNALGWSYNVQNGIEPKNYRLSSKDRHVAEVSALYDAFELLEKQP